MSYFNLFSVRKQLLALFFLLFSINIYSQHFFNNLEDSTVIGNWIGLQSVDSGNAYSGDYFSRTDSIIPYGLGIEEKFPQDVAGKNVYLKISGFTRSNIKNNNAIYVVTVINKSGETKLWKGIYLSGVLEDSDNWHFFSDSIKIPADQTRSNVIKAYLWNQNKNSTTDIDDLSFEFIPITNPSFIPEIVKPEISENYTLIYGNQLFSVFLSNNNSLVIKGINNSPLINNIFYYSQRRLNNDTITGLYNLEFKNVRTKGDETTLNFSVKDKWGKLKVIVICNNTSGKIKFSIEERFGKRQDVFRESLVINYALPVKEVYRQTRKVDSDFLQPEYWLDKQGVLFADKFNSMAVYHPADISSFQLVDSENILFVNLDYEKDHPFFRFPLEPDSTDWRVDQSYSSYKSDNRDYSFNIFINPVIETLPRFMKNPAGYEAAYIWTEHADFTNIRTNRATYFGSEKVVNPDSAIGGFVYYNIPVTKSVFYDNPDSVTNSYASNSKFNELESSIRTDNEYEDYLKQIRDIGHDICLHTPDHYTTTPELLEEALKYMQLTFGSPSWIDHGNNNGPENNREDLICDATLSKSPLYAVDLWNNYGVAYLHNAYYEELNTFGNWQFESSLEKPYGGFGDFFPKPDYYQHPTLTKELFHWSTSSALFISEAYLWNYMFNITKLKDMVDNWYIEINHVYPAWVDPKKGMWTYDIDSTIIAHPGLNTALSNLSKLRDEGRLNITTIADHLDYRTAIDNVSYEILNDGRIKVTNNNDTTISDLSMVSRAKAVSVDGFIPSHKLNGKDIIFWFDLEPGESRLIRVVR